MGHPVYTLSNGKRKVLFAKVLTDDVHDCPSGGNLCQPAKKNEASSGLRYNSVSQVLHVTVKLIACMKIYNLLTNSH
jgi:hypothetical protein